MAWLTSALSGLDQRIIGALVSACGAPDLLPVEGNG